LLHIWVVIGHNFRHISVLPPNRLDTRNYIDRCLAKVVPQLKEKKMTYIHDRASYHTSKDCRKYLNRKGVIYVESPARSADGAPIEQVWALIERRLQEMGYYGKDPMYISKLKEAFDSIPQAELNKLAASYHDRWANIVRAKGEQVPVGRREAERIKRF
jgi:transposase